MSYQQIQTLWPKRENTQIHVPLVSLQDWTQASVLRRLNFWHSRPTTRSHPMNSRLMRPLLLDVLYQWFSWFSYIKSQTIPSLLSPVQQNPKTRMTQSFFKNTKAINNSEKIYGGCKSTSIPTNTILKHSVGQKKRHPIIKTCGINGSPFTTANRLDTSAWYERQHNTLPSYGYHY